MKNIKELDEKYVLHAYKRQDVLFVEGKGCKLYDERGKEYIDFATGIAVNNLGLSNEKWLEAVIAQAKKLSHVSNYYYTEPMVELAELLCTKTNMKKVFFSNSGAEVNECAIKTARKYSYDKYGEGRHEIITLKHSFHGRTMATLTATGQDDFHQFFMPFVEGFVYAEPNDIEDLLQKVTDKTCAIMFELVQGEGGVTVMSEEYVKTIARLCKEKDILSIIDEVQTGNGRTGTLYTYMQYPIMPDILTTAKGIGGGLPIGAILFGEKTEDVLTYGQHGTTFGGNPIVCAGALEIVKGLTDEVLQGVNERFEFIKDYLKDCKKIKEISGKGLMVGLVCDESCGTSYEIVAKGIKKGIVLLTAKHKVRLMPPLNISYEDLKQGLDILKEVLA